MYRKYADYVSPWWLDSTLSGESAQGDRVGKTSDYIENMTASPWSFMRDIKVERVHRPVLEMPNRANVCTYAM